jgi:hypothetical protein
MIPSEPLTQLDLDKFRETVENTAERVRQDATSVASLSSEVRQNVADNRQLAADFHEWDRRIQFASSLVEKAIVLLIVVAVVGVVAAFTVLAFQTHHDNNNLKEQCIQRGGTWNGGCSL